MGMSSTGRLDKSIKEFDDLKASIASSKKSTQTMAMKQLSAILEKLLELISKLCNKGYAKVAEGKYVQSKTGTAVKDKAIMQDHMIEFDRQVAYAKRIMESAATPPRMTKIKKAIKQAKDELISMTKHQEKMKKNESRFHKTLPMDTSPYEDMRDNFSKIGKTERDMDGKDLLATMHALIDEFDEYTKEFDALVDKGFQLTEMGLSTEEQMAWAKAQKAPTAFFRNGNHVSEQKNKNNTKTITTIESDTGRKIVVIEDARGRTIEKTISDDTGVRVLNHENKTNIFTSLDGKTIIETDAEGQETKTIIADDKTTVTTPDGTSTEKSNDGLTVRITKRDGSDMLVESKKDGSRTETDLVSKDVSYFDKHNVQVDKDGNDITMESKEH